MAVNGRNIREQILARLKVAHVSRATFVCASQRLALPFRQMNKDGGKIREQVLALLSRKDYRPLNKIEIANKLGVSGRARVALRSTLRDLERAGEIARIRKDRYVFRLRLTW